MDEVAAKSRLLATLRTSRATLARKADGLSEYDARRPLTSTGTNILGLVKHCALWESRYLGDVFGRPFPEDLPPSTDHSANRASFWLRAAETRQSVLDLYERVAAHADQTVASLALDARGHVPWWHSDVTLHDVLVHLVDETARHAGHADILREQIDGAVGDDNLAPPRDATYWQGLTAEIERAARTALDS